ncbi:MAG: two-component sensor histidine kinase [Crocinitomicaceae bacterium]|jgi:two-component sensor histidine kinase
MERKAVIGSYVVKGILIGLLFPICSILLCYYWFSGPENPFSIIQLHKDFPLLLVIDTAPVVLGLISFLVGSQVDKSYANFTKQITEANEGLTEKNNQLEGLNVEKEVLLKEIHHRVKNNLQIITSLLSLQSSFIEDDTTKALFRYSQYRINSMAMIHEMLYKTEDVSKISYNEYVQMLVSSLIVSMKGTANNVETEVNVPDIHLNIDTAIPLGLLMNEIVTNSLKYGLKDDSAGLIKIEIANVRHNEYKMTISDNGVGFAEGINFRNSNSLGLMLIHRLTIQLKGNIEKENTFDGTKYILNFQEITQLS